ncbi:hypothetical protein BV25DRAFT_1920606 [Artomyces pyxidatus]|uniref:Uncharacterized protein n=1 Tax=Artomyces pyxidatus TaxID=48021 RepID=A0ACB8SKY3_9AGAM|nr:hypothetical protein BV25DRAFT_1920606 [Artomyces pyxidatus]
MSTITPTTPKSSVSRSSNYSEPAHTRGSPDQIHVGIFRPPFPAAILLVPCALFYFTPRCFAEDLPLWYQAVVCVVSIAFVYPMAQYLKFFFGPGMFIHAIIYTLTWVAFAAMSAAFLLTYPLAGGGVGGSIVGVASAGVALGIVWLTLYFCVRYSLPRELFGLFLDDFYKIMFDPLLLPTESDRPGRNAVIRGLKMYE